MTEELELLEAQVSEPEKLMQAGVALTRGRLDGRPVVMALSGIGKVNAASASQVLAALDPRVFLFLGVAGALNPDLEVGDLIVAEDAIQHDVDVTGLGYEPGLIPGETLAWRSDDGLVDRALKVASMLGLPARMGRVATGDRFVADAKTRTAIREAFGADCVEMEGAAAAQVCAGAGIPFVLIRSISDRANGEAEVDFRTFTRSAAENAARLARALLADLDD